MVSEGPRNTGILVLRRRVATDPDVSCDNDVGDALAVELEELGDNCGPTIDT